MVSWTPVPRAILKATRPGDPGGRRSARGAVDLPQYAAVGVPRRLGRGSPAIPHLSGPPARDPRLAPDPPRIRGRGGHPGGGRAGTRTRPPRPFPPPPPHSP